MALYRGIHHPDHLVSHGAIERCRIQADNVNPDSAQVCISPSVLRLDLVMPVRLINLDGKVHIGQEEVERERADLVLLDEAHPQLFKAQPHASLRRRLSGIFAVARKGAEATRRAARSFSRIGRNASEILAAFVTAQDKGRAAALFGTMASSGVVLSEPLPASLAVIVGDVRLEAFPRTVHARRQARGDGEDCSTGLAGSFNACCRKFALPRTVFLILPSLLHSELAIAMQARLDDRWPRYFASSSVRVDGLIRGVAFSGAELHLGLANLRRKTAEGGAAEVANNRQLGIIGVHSDRLLHRRIRGAMPREVAASPGLSRASIIPNSAWLRAFTARGIA